ncbi:glutathione S-transferase family protein [Aquabacterium sp. A7-Y]|uniref:glutathione S-transferase family protein n=1 Tax=Aquabacterium sp. A7-Y TaxID=1349605 RepID=UPI00223CCBF9|nr:glutathione S-transferase family protein [Aquabacterium sp. A7-Y]MCW7539308.1 glutathione S-transferase family protein [Aquabacterium sp. A7-Y]
MQLYIGNKNYSSWSLRPWLLMTHFGIPFEEVKLRLSFEAGSPFKTALAKITPTGKVPVLVDDDGFAVWDTLAICEYLAEKFPERGLWPAERQVRARARSVCAEMHAGFGALRQHFPMNIEAQLPQIGAEVLATKPEVARDLGRIVQMWSELLQTHGGPFLFGRFSIADAYFAPVCSRFRSYAAPLPAPLQAYVEAVFELPAMQSWVQQALAEQDFLDFDEPYRSARG